MMSMFPAYNILSQAFQFDHARLAQLSGNLRRALSNRDIIGARNIANDLDREAGAHIAFEEIDFYPALKPYLPEQDIEKLYLDHVAGLVTIEFILDDGPSQEIDERQFNMLIERIKAFEMHITVCGKIFTSMEALSSLRLQDLWERLVYWRRKAPRWTEIGERQLAPGP